MEDLNMEGYQIDCAMYHLTANILLANLHRVHQSLFFIGLILDMGHGIILLMGSKAD